MDRFIFIQVLFSLFLNQLINFPCSAAEGLSYICWETNQCLAASILCQARGPVPGRLYGLVNDMNTINNLEQNPMRV